MRRERTTRVTPAPTRSQQETRHTRNIQEQTMFLYSRQKASPSTQRLNAPIRENLQRFDEGRLSHQRCAAASRLAFATRNASWTKKGRTRPKSHQKPRSRRSSILTLHHGHSRLVTRALKTTTGQTQLPQILTIVVRSTISELQK